MHLFIKIIKNKNTSIFYIPYIFGSKAMPLFLLSELNSNRISTPLKFQCFFLCLYMSHILISIKLFFDLMFSTEYRCLLGNFPISMFLFMYVSFYVSMPLIINISYSYFNYILFFINIFFDLQHGNQTEYHFISIISQWAC
mgnify:CR=1 FL=1